VTATLGNVKSLSARAATPAIPTESSPSNSPGEVPTILAIPGTRPVENCPDTEIWPVGIVRDEEVTLRSLVLDEPSWTVVLETAFVGSPAWSSSSTTTVPLYPELAGTDDGTVVITILYGYPVGTADDSG
jgi:hypothetical protein